MTKQNKITQQEAKYYEDLGEQWANRDLADYWDQTQAVACDVNIQSEFNYYPVQSKLSAELDSMAKELGITPEDLLNKWLAEKLHDKSINK